ncbi:hypothetical protein BRC87_00730 [Halobacteriales archaeon QS_4_66_20]|nr:MAG: hypothetical protein BRC87_00730 [Halobacteriales archaeon QS_4_66_20]
MADTPNHEYNVPDQGDQDWHQPLNENFEEFEVDIELRDQESNLGDYDPTDGAKFLATDTGVVYLGDGTDWNATFLVAEYDDSTGEATISGTLATSKLDVGSISGSLTGGTELSNIAGSNLSIDSNGQLNASGGGGGGGGGISSLSGGDGIDPASIGDGDTLSVAWGDANDLDSDGNVTGGGGGGGGEWTANNTLLEPSDSSIDGIDVDEVNAELLAASGPAIVTVNGERVLELTAQSGGDAGNLIAGHSSNSVGSGVSGATIAGGGFDDGTDVHPNEVTADYGAVGGGEGNEATEKYATVGGGDRNAASGERATVGGGRLNVADMSLSTVGGGQSNSALYTYAAVGGGRVNEASGFSSTVAGGEKNAATASHATVAGGENNEASASQATLGGGRNNTASGERSTLSGGRGNETTEFAATVAGGQNCHARGQFATAGGGQWNEPTGPHATIAGGEYNEAYGKAATIAGGGDPDSDGTGNVVYDDFGTIGGGGSNQAGSDDGDTTTATFATVVGGENNVASAQHATVLGGQENEASGNFSIALGRNATASDPGSLVVGDSTSDEITSIDADEARFQGPLRSDLLKTEERGVWYYPDDQAEIAPWRTFYDDSSDEWRVDRWDTSGSIPVWNRKMWVTASGDIEAEGAKNFVETVDTDDGEKEVVYTASESGTAHTEESGVAELDDGRAEIALPDHFGMVTDDDEPLVVQTTPYGGSAGLKVVEHSTDRLVVEDLDGEGDYEFAYTVKGTRDGYADKEVVREPSASAESTGSPTPADD